MNPHAKPTSPGVCGGLCTLLAASVLACIPAVRAETASDFGLVEEIVVEAEGPSTQTEVVEEAPLEMGRYASLGLALETLPGVSGVRRSLNAVEPVIRGLGWERVQTQVNGLPIYGACPGRMDPPVNLVARTSIEEASVVKGLSSVTLGPAGTGGRIMLSTDFDRGADAGRDLDFWARTAFDDAANASNVEAGVRGGTERLDYSLGFETLDQSDYESGDGTVVPSSQEEKGASLSLGGRPTDSQRIFGSIVAQDTDDIDYPALPMDEVAAETRLYNVGYRLLPSRKSLTRLDLRVGAGTVDHVMDNRNKPNRSMMEARADTESDSFSAGLDSDWMISDRSALEAGLDFGSLQRDAIRERYIVVSGQTFYDHIWPDVTQDDLGAFVEYHLVPASRWNLRIGARLDAVSSEADGADDPSLGGNTVRESYVRFYGSEAADTDRDEDLASGNVMISRTFDNGVKLEAGVGLAARAASVTERYYAFAPAPGGFMVGNPTLDAEQKRELIVGTSVGKERWSGNVSVYYYSFADYINPTVIEEADVNGDGIDDLIRGFVNVDADVWGGELSAAWKVTDRVELPLALAYVRGENDDTGNPLPLIPAPEARAAARFTLSRERQSWLELGGRFVDDQHRVDPDYRENPTPGYSVFHLRGGFDIGRHLVLEAGVENLFDKEYWEHLTPQTPLPVGDLMKGDEIPQPGRSLLVAARLAY